MLDDNDSDDGGRRGDPGRTIILIVLGMLIVATLSVIVTHAMKGPPTSPLLINHAGQERPL